MGAKLFMDNGAKREGKIESAAKAEDIRLALADADLTTVQRNDE